MPTAKRVPLWSVNPLERCIGQSAIEFCCMVPILSIVAQYIVVIAAPAPTLSTSSAVQTHQAKDDYDDLDDVNDYPQDENGSDTDVEVE